MQSNWYNYNLETFGNCHKHNGLLQCACTLAVFINHHRCKSVLRLYLLRHAQSVNNAEPNPEKHQFDPPLTELGQKQSCATAHLLQNGSDNGALRYGYDIKHIYTSPQLRALQTTLPIAKDFDIRPEIWIKTHERGGVVILHRRGVQHHHGITRSEVATLFPNFKIPYQIREDGWWRGKNGLESNEDTFVRARVVANDIWMKARTAQNTGILMVSHGTFLNFLMQILLRDTQNKYLHFNAGLSRIDIDRSTQTTLKYLNYTTHLDQNWIT